MDERENILKRIGSALRRTDTEPHPGLPGYSKLFADSAGSLTDRFIAAFTAIDGKVLLCKDVTDMLEQLQQLIVDRGGHVVNSRSAYLSGHAQHPAYPDVLRECPSPVVRTIEVGITDCECLVANTGTVVMSSSDRSGRAFSVYTPVHIVIATERQLVYDLEDGIALMMDRYAGRLPSGIFFVSGPSRTGDIEKTLVLGVHGPVEIYVLLIEEE